MALPLARSTALDDSILSALTPDGRLNPEKVFNR
jgi:hypothetical protein